MSSILDALKKVERSTAGEAAPVEVAALAGRGAGAVGGIRAWRRPAVVAGVLAAAAAAGLWLYGGLPGSGGGSPAPAESRGSDAAPAALQAKTPPPGPQPSARPAVPPARPAPAAERVIEMQADPSPPAALPGAPRSGRPAAPPAESRPSAPRREAPPTPATVPRAGRPTPARPAEEGLPRLDESKLKVMAIAWADDPARRIAVVNGHVLKEGDSVDGYRIAQIRKDDLLVSDGGRTYRVEFSLKPSP